MKKLSILFSTLLLFAFANATTLSKDSNNDKTKKMALGKTMQVTAYDACGQKLMFTISCSSCTLTALAAGADSFIFNSTDSRGCFTLNQH